MQKTKEKIWKRKINQILLEFFYFSKKFEQKNLIEYHKFLQLTHLNLN